MPELLSRMTVRSFFLLLFVCLAANQASPASATEFNGEVKNSGGPAHRKTSIKLASESTLLPLCRGGEKFALEQLAKSTVTISGTLKSESGEHEKCLYAESFKINEIAPGRPAIVGVLKALEKHSYAVVSEEGRVWKLSSLAIGLKGLIGKKVVCDLVADSSPTGETTWLVARIFGKP